MTPELPGPVPEIPVREIKAAAAYWRARNSRLLSAPASKPWGLHEFTAADLDGNLFRVFYDFATPGRATDA